MEATTLDQAVASIKSALVKVLDPLTKQQERKAASEYIENFKESSQFCASCCFTIYSDHENDPAVRHSGIYMATDFVRTKWNDLPPHIKEEFKQNSLKKVFQANFTEPGHLKDGLAKFVVELIKREWPQCWPGLFKDLSNIAQAGHAQTELVLLILLRLAEDVVCFDNNLKQLRRREMLQSLNANMENLLSFFLSTLQHSYSNFREQGTKNYFRLCEGSLYTLQGFLDWIHFQYIFYDNNELLRIFCLLLRDPSFRMPALDCLLVTLSRKGDIHSRLGFLVLLSDDAMTMFSELIRDAAQAEITESNHLFFRKLAEALAILGYTQLTAIWDGDKGINKAPDNFARYLDIMVDLTGHPSLVVGTHSLRAWTAFFKHTLISKDESLRVCMPKILLACWKNSPKFGHPSKDNHPRCKFSKIEVDSDEEFIAEFAQYRYYMHCNIEECTAVYPVEVICEILSLLMDRLKEPESEFLQGVADGNKGMDHLRWEATSVFVMHVVKKLASMEELWKEPAVFNNIVETGRKLLDVFLNYGSKIPLVMQDLLSCLAALFPILKYLMEALPAVLERIFSAITFIGNQEVGAALMPIYSKHLVALRRHAASTFLDLCKELPTPLLEVFDELETRILSLFGANLRLHFEKVACLEGLLILSQHFPESGRQASLLTKLFSPVKALFQSEEVSRALADTSCFITTFALNKPAEDSHLHLVSQIDNAVDTIMSTVRRCKILQRKNTESGVIVVNSLAEGQGTPWVPVLVPLLPSIFLLLRQLQLIWKPEHRSFVAQYNQDLYELAIAEKFSILGLTAQSNEDSGNSEGNERQHLFRSIYESSCNILGQCCDSLGPYLYDISDLHTVIIQNIIETWCWLPKWRLRGIFTFSLDCQRIVFQKFPDSLPSEKYTTVLGPIMGYTLDWMLMYFDAQWKQVMDNKGIELTDDNIEDLSADMVQDNQIKEEILEERSLHHLHKEYTEILIAVSLRRTSNDLEGTVLADMGHFLVENEATGKSFVFTLFSALTWPNFLVVNKITAALPPVIDKIASLRLQNPIDPGIVEHLFVLVIKGLSLHGNDNSTRGHLVNVGYHLYMTMRPLFPSLANVILMVPSCTKEALQEFETMLANRTDGSKGKSEKQYRESFKKLLSAAPQKSVSELYKQDVDIKDLPPLAPRKKRLPQDVVGESEDSGLCALFNND